MNAVEARKAQDAARGREFEEDAKLVVEKLLELEGDLHSEYLLHSLLGVVHETRDRFGQVGVSNHSQDGATVIGGRCLFRLVPRLAGWVREIQKKAGAHGAIRVVEIDGRTFLEPTKEK